MGDELDERCIVTPELGSPGLLGLSWKGATGV